MDRRRFVATTAVAAAALPGIAPGLPLPHADDETYWRNLRREFLMPRDETFFNTGTLGSSPKAVVDAVVRHLIEVDRTIAHWDYRPDHPDWFAGYRPEPELRAKLAGLINATGDEIALTQNATVGENYIAHGLPLEPGDEVIMTSQEHPGNQGGWDLRAKRFGIVVKKVPIPVPPADVTLEQIVQLYADAITPRTRVLVIPHITSQFAIRLPVKELSALGRAHNCFTTVDGAQVIGHLKVDVRDLDCDAYYSSPHKWLLSPKGTGFLYVRKERLPEVWATLASATWNNYDVGAYRLMQIGTGNLSLLKGLDAAIDFHHQTAGGPERVEARILWLASRLRAGLARIPGAALSSPKD
ncbi:MAG: aminotransferase class V-fold PLP-dependent enzyme, partial [Gemmatimonadales bacterium]